MKVKSLALPLIAAMLAGGCGRPTPEATTASQTNAASSGPGPAVIVDSSQPVAPRSRNEFVDDLHRKLDLCDQKISELGRKMETLNEEAKVETAKAMESWRVQRAQLEPKLEEIKKSGQEAGQEIKAGCEAAVAELEKAFEKLKSKFKD